MADTKIFAVYHLDTGVEVTWQDLARIALDEAWADGLVYCDMDGWAIDQDGGLFLMDECGNYRYPPENRFIVKWRSQHDA